MKKIALAGIINETCSFNPVRTTLQDFKDCIYKLGQDVAAAAPDERVIGGFLAEMKGKGDFQFEGIIGTFAQSGGEMTAETFDALNEILLSGVKKAGKLDAVFLNLMGANVSQGEPDTTGAMLAGVRKLVGKDVFLHVSLDHHGNVTRRMVREADVILGYDDQPHSFPVAGAKAARVLLDIWKKGRRPHAAMVKVPMLAPQDRFLTSEGPMKEWFDFAREIEKDPKVIVASCCPTQPWLDVPDNGWSCLVYADDDATARRHAERLAQKVWDLRAEFWRSDRLSAQRTIEAANAEPKGLVLISDTGDSIWGGAYGDSTVLIGEILKQGINGAALVPIVDPEAQILAIKAGIGRQVTLRLGGKKSAAFCKPIDVTGAVKVIAEAGVREFGNGIVSMAGRTVLFESGNLKLVIMEQRDFPVNLPVMYEKLGVDIPRAKLVVLKTGSNFQYFAPYRSRLIRADTPGETQSDLTQFTWKHRPRPMYPFEELKDWTPKAS